MTIEQEHIDNMESSQDMTRPQIDKMDSRYIAACIAEVPMLSDPQEAAIVKLMEKEIIATPAASDMVEEVRRFVRENANYLHLQKY